MDRTDDRPANLRRAIDVIETARTRSRTSIRAAAAEAGTSDAWWRAIVRGYLPQHGAEAPAIPSIKTLLAMARTVGVEAQVRELLGEEPIDENIPTPAELRAMSDADLREAIMEIARRYPEDQAIQHSVQLLITLTEQHQESRKTG